MYTAEMFSASKAMKDSPTSKDGIPWPALDTLYAGNLKKTATAIMKEWERSLTPTPSERVDPIDKSSSDRSSSQEQEARMSLSNLP